MALWIVLQVWLVGALVAWVLLALFFSRNGFGEDLSSRHRAAAFLAVQWPVVLLALIGGLALGGVSSIFLPPE
jgi:hypothetical protein